MNKTWLYLFSLLCLIGCGQRNTRETGSCRLDNAPSPSYNVQIKARNDSSKTEIQVKEDLVHPAGGGIATDFKYLNFGRIGHYDRSFKEDTLVFPPIEGLVHKTAFSMCPTDTCFSEYVVLALRCPPVQTLLNWVSDTVRSFIKEFPLGHRMAITAGNPKEKKSLTSDKAICDYFINQLQHAYDDWHCTGGDDHDHDVLNYQAGLLISDCWSSKNLCTFYIIEWMDLAGNGYNSQESYLTIDARSGKPMSISDLIHPDKFDSLAALMMPRLINGKKEYYIRQVDIAPEEYIGILNRANGCALISEGLIIYYYAYNLGFGCDGQYEAVIPYKELVGLLNTAVSPQSTND